MNKILIIAMAMALVMGLSSASSQGFGEIASLNSCHCLKFNSTNPTNTWTLINTFNKSISFYVIKPKINNVTINVSIANGTIPANSNYPITIIVVSHSAKNESGEITAYAVPNTSNSTGGASIKIGIEKLLEIAANATVVAQLPQQQKSSNQSTIGSTIASSTVLTTAVSTTIQSTSKSAAQGALGSSAASIAAILSYLIGAVVILLIVVCVLSYYVIREKRPSKGKKSN